jgi:hypothetical protein
MKLYPSTANESSHGGALAGELLTFAITLLCDVVKHYPRHCISHKLSCTVSDFPEALHPRPNKARPAASFAIPLTVPWW